MNRYRKFSKTSPVFYFKSSSILKKNSIWKIPEGIFEENPGCISDSIIEAIPEKKNLPRMSAGISEGMLRVTTESIFERIYSRIEVVREVSEKFHEKNF